MKKRAVIAENESADNLAIILEFQLTHGKNLHALVVSSVFAASRSVLRRFLDKLPTSSLRTQNFDIDNTVIELENGNTLRATPIGHHAKYEPNLLAIFRPASVPQEVLKDLLVTAGV